MLFDKRFEKFERFEKIQIFYGMLEKVHGIEKHI
jgi:hypothetical protein